MAKDLFRPGDPADLNPPITLPSFGDRPASGISLRRTNARAPRESIDDLLAALPDVPAAAPAAPASKGWGQTLLEGVTKGVETAGLGMTAQTGRDPAAVASQLQDTQIPRSSEEQAFDQQTADAAKAFDDADGDDFEAVAAAAGQGKRADIVGVPAAIGRLKRCGHRRRRS